jgi:small subunit ribosomal protein S1
MEVEAESIEKKNVKEFQDLLNKDMENRVLKEGSIIEARITEITPKWVQLDANAKSDSTVASSEFENLASLKVGDMVSVLLERIEDYRSGQLVLSRYKAILLKNWVKLTEAYKKEKIVTGIIKSRTRGGYLAVVMGSNCFLPGSAISDQPIKPDEANKLFNKEVQMRVVSINEQRMNCIVSIKEVHMKDKQKQLQLILKKIKAGDILTKTDGFELTINALNDWAAWILISIDGASAIAMAHITQLSYERLRKPSDILSLNQNIPRIKVLDIDKTANPPRISLSLKAIMPDPFDGIEKRYVPNSIHEAKVVRILSYGAFLELEPKIQCLLHQSQMDFFNKNIDPNKKVNLGQQIKVRILKIADRKISVSLLTEEDPWQTFLKKFKEGDLVKCEVERVLDFGIMLKIEKSGIPAAICHWKNLSFEESEENLKKWKKAMKTDAKILSIEKEKMKVRLGVREASKNKDPFEYFSNKENFEIITATVREVLKNGIKVSPGNETNLLITIKKSHLAKRIEDCRPEIFRRGDRISAMIINLKKSLRKADLSIKEMEKYNEAIAIKKFGKDGSSSGKVLKDILGKVFKSEKTKKDKEG